MGISHFSMNQHNSLFTIDKLLSADWQYVKVLKDLA